MVLTDKQKIFIKNNRHILRDLFKARILELQDLSITEIDDKQRIKLLDLAQEFLRWLRDIKIIEDEGKEKPKEKVI